MCNQELHSEINWTFIKDVALVLLSIGALISGFVLNKLNRDAEWINNFRKEVACFMGFIESVYTKNEELEDGCRKLLPLLFLYLDKDNALHEKFYIDLNTLLDFQLSKGQRVENKNYAADREALIASIYSTAKEIIRQKQFLIFPVSS